MRTWEKQSDQGLKCPVCGRFYTERPALSRKDGTTKICPDCGIKEALDDYPGNIQPAAQRFYFSFGSDPGFPHQNTYVIVLAETMQEAIAKFRKKYPDRHENTVNCAFWYSEEQWRGSRNESMYGEPAEVIS